MMEYIKDQTVNTYNAEIVDEFNTPEKRQQAAERIVHTMFKSNSAVEFYGLNEFNRISADLSPSIYWTYVFTVVGMGAKMQTITLGNDGGIDFNFHRLGIKSFNIAMSVK